MQEPAHDVNVAEEACEVKGRRAVLVVFLVRIGFTIKQKRLT